MCADNYMVVGAFAYTHGVCVGRIVIDNFFMITDFEIKNKDALLAIRVRFLFPRSLHRLATSLSGAASLFFFVLAFVLGGHTMSLVLFLWCGATFLLLLFLYGFIETGLKGSFFFSLKDRLAEYKTGRASDLTVFLDFHAAGAMKDIINRAGIADVFRLTATIMSERSVHWVFSRLALDEKDAVKWIKQSSINTLAKKDFVLKLIEEAATYAVKRHHATIGVLDIFWALSQANPALRQYLFDHAIEPADLDAVIRWQDRLWHMSDHRRKFWLRENLFRTQPIGKEWSAGYINLLSSYSRDITDAVQARGLDFHVVGRKKEIDAMEQILAKAGENNVLLVGEPGVGRETIIYGFAKRLLEGRSLPQLNRQKLIELDLSAAIAGLKTAGEVDGRIKELFSEAVQARNVILIIQNLHHFLGTEFSGGVIDISRAVLPYIKDAHMQLIAITTHSGLHEKVEKAGELASAFQSVEVQEPTLEQAVQILVDVIPRFEWKYKVFIPYATIKSIVQLSDKYVQNVPFPEKAIDLLAEICVHVVRDKKKIITIDDVAAVVSSRAQVPVGSVGEDERDKLLHLEDLIHARIVDQEEAVNAIANAMRRARAGVGDTSNRPIGSFLFLGPTGVGKTETAKALAQVYFGSDERMIRFDMSEYNAPDAEQRLLGSPVIHAEGTLTTAVRDNPFSLLLLDELEKSNPKVLDLFLQVLDEGHLTDGWGKRVSFTHTIIIATSNAGADFIRQAIHDGKKGDELSKGLIEHLLSKNLFKPEFVNRFDGVIVFKPLEQQHVEQIIRMMLKSLSHELFHEKGIKVEADDAAVKKILELGYNPEFGGRELRRIMQESVENVIARKILGGEIKRGDTFTIKDMDLK